MLCETDAFKCKSCNNKFVVQLKQKDLENTSIQQVGQKFSGVGQTFLMHLLKILVLG